MAVPLSTRRELIHVCLGAAVAGSACRRARSLDVDGVFVDPSFRRGHAVREPGPSLTTAPAYETKVLVLGGGVSGLSAAWALRAAGLSDVTVLELESAAGGTAVGATSPLGGYPWGAHYLPAPRREQADLVRFLDEVGLVASFEDGQPRYVEAALCALPRERVFDQGRWHAGLLAPRIRRIDGAGLSRFQTRMRAFAGTMGADGKPAFTMPVSRCSEDPRLRGLDEVDFESWLRREGLWTPSVRWLADYATRDDFGARPKQTSAWFGIHYHAARLDPDGRSAPFLTWPEGNQRLVHHLATRLGPRLQTERCIHRVRPHPSGRGLEVLAVGPKGAERWQAERVIWALPSFLERHLLEGFGDPAESAETSAWLVANLHLRRRPRRVGVETAWDNVIADSRALGYVVATHQVGPPVGPTTWTWYLPLVDLPALEARKSLMAMSWREGAELVLADLERAHPELRDQVTRIDLRRWGHAMPIPSPGALSRGAARRSPRGDLFFAHADRSEVGLFEEAFDHGVRAAREALG